MCGYRWVLKGTQPMGKGASGTPGSAVGDKTTVSGPTHPKSFRTCSVCAQTPKCLNTTRKIRRRGQVLHTFMNESPAPGNPSLQGIGRVQFPYLLRTRFRRSKISLWYCGQQTSVSHFHGELFNSVRLYVPLIQNRLIDFIRIPHFTIGAFHLPVRCKPCASFWCAYRLARARGRLSYCPCSPVALELSSYNSVSTKDMYSKREVFPGCPEVKDGYMFCSGKTGTGNRH